MLWLTTQTQTQKTHHQKRSQKQLNGSGQERNRHFDWNFQVCQNPPKLREPTCMIWKDVPVLFFPKSRKTWQTGLKFSFNPPPPPPPPPHTHTHTHPNCSFPPEKCWIWIHETWETPCYTVGWWGVERENFRPVCQVFFPAFRGKQHRNIFYNTGTSFHITQVGLRSLGGFWHTWKFQSKWRLRPSIIQLVTVRNSRVTDEDAAKHKYFVICKVAFVKWVANLTLKLLFCVRPSYSYRDKAFLTLALPRVINFKCPLCSLTRNITSHSKENLAFHTRKTIIYYQFSLHHLYLSQSLTLSLPSSKSTFSQPSKEKCISAVVRTGSIIIFHLIIFHFSSYEKPGSWYCVYWCNIFGEAAGEN